MSSLSAKDRVSLCSFTFSDGRRCRTPRVAKNPHFCAYHAEKEARARTTQKLGKDLDFFFSGNYLSACDLSTALARLIPAVVRGDVKPKTAHTVAYLMQTLLQAIHIAQHEYTNTFGTDGWRKSICNSVNGNRDYRFPPAPKPQAPAPHPTAPTVGALDVAAGLQPGSSPGNAHIRPAQPQTQPPQPAPSPHTPLPPTSAEFVQRVLAGQTGQKSSRPASPIPSSPGGQHSPQQPSEPQPPVAAPSASRQEPQPAAAPQTGPSGLPVLASLPPRKPGAPPGARPS